MKRTFSALLLGLSVSSAIAEPATSAVFSAVDAHTAPASQSRYLAIDSDKTVKGLLERLSWTNDVSFKWEAPLSADYRIVDIAGLNYYGELATARTFNEAVEHLMDSIQRKRLSRLGIEPLQDTEDAQAGDYSVPVLFARLYRKNNTLIIGTPAQADTVESFPEVPDRALAANSPQASMPGKR
jgi:hypothetical protein